MTSHHEQIDERLAQRIRAERRRTPQQVMIPTAVRALNKLFVATLLTLCVGVHALEGSGHWDRTFQDANDEAGIVAVVLCIGIAISVADTILKRALARTLRAFVIAPSLGPVRLAAIRLTVPCRIAGPPPVPLRI